MARNTAAGEPGRCSVPRSTSELNRSIAKSWTLLCFHAAIISRFLPLLLWRSPEKQAKPGSGGNASVSQSSGTACSRSRHSAILKPGT
jgi:hypothetical protein